MVNSPHLYFCIGYVSAIVKYNHPRPAPSVDTYVEFALRAGTRSPQNDVFYIPVIIGIFNYYRRDLIFTACQKRVPVDTTRVGAVLEQVSRVYITPQAHHSRYS
jgi:hypothetical protein